MLTIRAEPAHAQSALAASETVARLVSGDALDLAMYGWSFLGSVVQEARAAGATAIELAADPAGELHDEMAAKNGFAVQRELVQLRRSLPVHEPSKLAVRSFRPGADDDAWLAVNNRSFDWHPEQRNWGRDDLRARVEQPWFDPEGLLLHERDGRLAGFCWTKVHTDERPPVGEIFVIGVDPDFQGHGIGRGLVLAGLDHLAGKGITTAMLYTEADNVVARAMYDALGFEYASSQRWYRRELTPPS